MASSLAPVRVARTAGLAHLAVEGQPFRFLIGNAYYLVEEAARGRLDLVDETLGKLASLGVSVVRTWAFNDDPNKQESALRLGPRGLHEPGLRGLDRVLARARTHGLRLILPLSNYWNAYGGTRQWCLWQGLSDAREGDPRFFTDADVRGAFAGHVAELLSHHNPLTGLRYGEDPVVLAWELMNEPRGDGLSSPELIGWIRAMARVVRGHAQQLISLGDEGQERGLEGYDASFWQRAGGAQLFSSAQGAAFSRHLELEELDLASLHFYPEKYGISPGAEREAGERWITEHARLAQAAHKPLYVGELGLANEGASFARLALPERRAIYRAWFAAALRAGVAGIGPWLFCYDERPDRWDDFSWYARTGLPRDAEENRYADLVAEAAAQLSGAPPPSR